MRRTTTRAPLAYTVPSSGKLDWNGLRLRYEAALPRNDFLMRGGTILSATVRAHATGRRQRWGAVGEDAPVTGMQDKLTADIHTFLGLIAGLQQSGHDGELLDLLTEQLRIRQDELNSASTDHGEPSPEDLRQWGSETEKLIAEIKSASADPKLDWVRERLEERLEEKRGKQPGCRSSAKRGTKI